jgi:hypothetical protein
LHIWAMSVWNLSKHSALNVLLVDGSGISTILTLAFMLAVTSLVLHLLTRFLYWSRKKTLPGAESPVFNTLVVGLIALIAMLSLVGLEPMRMLSLFGEEILLILGEGGCAVLAIFGAVSLIILVFAQRIKRA